MKVYAKELVADTGMSFRQIDHWTRSGYLISEASGKGRNRYWTEDEYFIAMEMSQLIRSGFTVEAAAMLARKHVMEPSTDDRYQLEGIEVRFVS